MWLYINWYNEIQETKNSEIRRNNSPENRTLEDIRWVVPVHSLASS